MAALVASGLPAHAGVEDNKTYIIDIDGTVGSGGDVYAGDTDAAITITIRNTSPSQSIEAANVTFPTSPVSFAVSPSDGDDAVVGGPVVELRNLAIAPGGQKAVTISVDVRTCGVQTPLSFTADVRQSNNFSGAGNEFFRDPSTPSDLSVGVTGPCQLAFVSAPADAELGARITSVAFTPDGAPIRVEVRDAGNTGRATHSNASIAVSAAYATPTGAVPGVIGGTTTATAVAGLATFSPGPTLSPSAFGYTMTAKSSGLTDSQPSSPSFVIVDDRVVCATGSSCTASANKGNQNVTVTFDGQGGTSNLLVSLNAADVPQFECAGYPRPAGQLVSQFTFTDDNADTKTGTMSVTIPNATNPVNQYQACWAAPYQFVTLEGTPLTALGTLTKDGQQVYFGLLPDCAKRGTPTPPCVSGRSFNRATQTATVTVFTTGKDPWRY